MGRGEAGGGGGARGEAGGAALKQLCPQERDKKWEHVTQDLDGSPPPRTGEGCNA